jgi:hypothetical protein
MTNCNDSLDLISRILIYILEIFDNKLSKYQKITQFLKYELIIAEPLCLLWYVIHQMFFTWQHV